MSPTSQSMSPDFRAGAQAEAALRYEGMRDDAKHVYQYVRSCARNGYTADHIISSTPYVFSTKWSFKQRFRLARRILFRKW